MLAQIKKTVPSLLALAIAVQPTLASARIVTQVAPQALPTTLGNAAAAVMGTQGTGAPFLSPALMSLELRGSIVDPGTALLPTQSAVQSAAAAQAAPRILSPRLNSAAPAADRAFPRGSALQPRRAQQSVSPAAAPGRKAFAERVSSISKGVQKAAADLPALSGALARPAASAQFDILIGGLSAARNAGVDPVPAGKALGRTAASLKRAPSVNAADAGRRLEVFKPVDKTAPPVEDAAAPKKGLKRFFTFKIFKDPERNAAYWRFFLGEQSIMVGFYMYMVALPFYMQSFTANMLRDAGTFDQTTKEALAEQVRQNRALSRIAHWVAQGVAYLALPFFTRGDHGPRRWLTRSAFARGILYGGIFGTFYLTGVLSAQAALYVLLGLIGLASFFQGISVTMSSGASARIVGDKSVTPSERMKANSVRTFVSAIIAVIAPVLAGKILGLGALFGKDGGGGALIYGIYAASMGVAGLIFATIKMLAKKKAVSEATGEHDALGIDNAKQGFFGTIKGIFSSMKDGIKIVWGNRFLRTLVLINLAVALFSDPLIFNALPQYVSQILTANPGAVDGLLQVPILGWFLDGLLSTPGGLFALLMTSSSIGSAISAVFAEPLRKIMKRWFKTEESLTIPFYILAALGVPAFWAMISFPSMWTVLGLYGLQTLLGGFIGLTITGLYQKNLGAYSSKQMNQVLAASSFINIIAAIAATYVYGFVLSDIPLQTMLIVAAIATTVAGLLQVAAPWLMFSKEQRKGGTPALRPQGVENDQPKIPLDSSATPDNVTGPLDVKL